MRRTRQSTKSCAQLKYEESDDTLEETVDTTKRTNKRKSQVKQKSNHSDRTLSKKERSKSEHSSEEESFSPEPINGQGRWLSSESESEVALDSEDESEEEYESSDDSDFEEPVKSKASAKRQSKHKILAKRLPTTNGKSTLFSKLKIPIKDSGSSSHVKETRHKKAKAAKAKSGEASSGSSSDEFVRVLPSEALDAKISPYFSVQKDDRINDFSEIESKILTDVTEALSDSDSEVEYTEIQWPSLPRTSSSLPDPVKSVDVALKTEPVVVTAQKSSSRQRKRGKTLSKMKCEVNDDATELDVLQLLKLGEGFGLESQDVGKYVPSDEDSDLEEVTLDDEEVPCKTEEKPHTIPKEGVQITLDAPEIFHKRKKKDFDMEAYLLRRLNNRKRSIQVLIHKVHLLAYIYHGQFVNSVLNSEDLMGLSLSLIPSKHCYPPKRADLGYLESILKWFKKTVPLKEDVMTTFPVNLLQSLHSQFNTKTANSKRDLVFMFICILRSLGIQARLVLSLQPAPLKLASTELCTSLAKQTDDIKAKSVKTEPSEDDSKPGPSKNKTLPEKITKARSNRNNIKRRSGDSKLEDKKSKYFEDKADKSQTTQATKSQSTGKRTRSNSYGKTSEYFKSSEDGSSVGVKGPVTSESPKKELKVTKAIESQSRSRKTLPSRQAKAKKPVAVVTPSDSDEEDFEPQPKRRKTKDLVEKKVPASKTSKNTVKKAVQSKKRSTSRVMSDDGDSDFEPVMQSSESESEVALESEDEFVAQNIPVVKLPSREWSGKLDRRVLSTDSEDDTAKKSTTKNRRKSQAKKTEKNPDKKKIGVDVWAEVFLEAEEKWFSVDVPKQKVHCFAELLTKATQPVLYVVGFNTDASIKDVTRRYVVNWTTIKQRVDETWWEKAIAPFLGKKTPQDLEEDEELSDHMLNHPLPTVIGEYKNHPLYALKRHLLKFEAIYPADAPTLGFVRGEAVYSRECVAGLHSREVWVKQAKVVRPGEQPYKIVKARPKYDRMSGTMITDMPLEVFGEWQVGEYVPPVAENGKVPRNEYGNVELFKACMLPKGTVHLPIPGLSRVAKKLGIDCAPAMIGFDYHKGGSHPTYDGYVVCEEHKDVLMDAWHQEEVEAEKRATEKREKRVYDNWKRIIKGLLIRERLQTRYSFGEVEPSTSKAKPKKTGGKSNRKCR